MTPTDKQKCIAEQAIYGDLRIQVGDSIRITNGAFTEYRGEYVRYVEFECRDSTGMLNINKIKPILRPMSDLTKEITHKGYNDDKPFVPLVHLFQFLMGEKLNKQDYKKCEISYLNSVSPGDHDDDFYAVMNFEDFKLEVSDQGIPYLYKVDDNGDYKLHIISIGQYYYDLLNFWHFDTRNLIDKGEAIDVNTLSVNPYEVK